jgi:hypothetical protein
VAVEALEAELPLQEQAKMVFQVEDLAVKIAVLAPQKVAMDT